MKIYFLLIILIFSISFSSAIKLTASPSNIEIISTVNQKNCSEISIYSDKENILEIEDKWSLKDSLSIEDYSLSSKQINLKISYPKKINKEGKFSICITPEKEGKYYGIILISSIESPVSLAIKISIKAYKEENNLFLIILTLNTTFLSISLLILIKYRTTQLRP